MRLSRMQWAAAVATLFAAGAIGLTQLPGLLRGSLNHYQQAAYIKLGNMPVPGTPLYDSLKDFDYGCFTTGWWEQPGLQSLSKEVQKRNPRFNAGSYLTVFALADWMKAAPDTSINGDWYQTMAPYMAMTTEGDTAMIYPRARVVNYLTPGAISAAKEVWNRHLTKPSARQVRWLMMDFCSSPLPDMLAGHPNFISEQQGSMDLDGDGVDHWQDSDEQAAWRQANIDLMLALHEIRPDISIIPNGALAIQDPEFSKIVDGCYIEGFPQWFFSGSWQYDHALDPNFSHSIPNLAKIGRFRATPGYVMVEDTYDTGIPGRLSGLFDAVIEVRRSKNDQIEPNRPVDLRSLGAPLAPAQPGVPYMSRNFENGRLSLTVISPRQVNYQIEAN